MTKAKAKPKPAAGGGGDAGGKPRSLVFYPFAYALLDDELENYCWYCLRPPPTAAAAVLKKCSGCHAARFCGKQCQDAGWLDHRAECHALQRCPQGVVPLLEVRMLARIVTRYRLIMAGKDKSKQFYASRTSERGVMELCAHADDMRGDQYAYDKFEKIYTILTNLYPEKELMEKEVVFQLHCRNYINRHAISDAGYTKEIGKGLYLDLCAYDHSCRPNTIFKCDGFVATMRPLNNSVDIRDRSATFYTYVDLLNAKQPRRKMLKDSWYFDCACERCADEGEHVLSSVKCAQCGQPVVIFGALALKDLNTFTLHCAGCKSVCPKERVTDALGAMRYIDQLCDRGDVDKADNPKFVAENFLQTFGRTLPDVNIYLVRLIQSCIGHTPQSDHGNQFAYHERVLPALRVCYPANHPTLAYHLMALAGIAANFAAADDRFARGLLYAAEAQCMFEFALGDGHPLAERARGNRDKLYDMQEVHKSAAGSVANGEERRLQVL